MKTRCFKSGFRHRMLPVAFLGIFMAFILSGKVSADSTFTGNRPADAELNKEYTYDTILVANGGMFTKYDEDFNKYDIATDDIHFAWEWISDTIYDAKFIFTIPKRDGYELIGWSRNTNVSVPEWDCYFSGMLSDVSNTKNYPEKIYAVWAKIYEITLNTNGGGSFGSITTGGKSDYLYTKKVGFYYDPLEKAVKYTDQMKPWPWSIDEDKILAAWDRVYGPELEGLVLNENTPDQLFADWEYKDLKDAKVYYVSDKEYTGKSVTQNPEVCTLQYDIKLKEGTDYTLSYQNNVNVGTATVTIKGIGRYTGSTSRTFKIYETTKPETDTEGSGSDSADAETEAAGTIFSDKKSSAKYKVLKDKKTVQYKAPLKKTAKKITIPATVKLDGKTYKVTSIGAEAFKGCSKLRKVTIGKNVATIGKRAFENCKKLENVTLGSKIISIGEAAFRGCTGMKTVTIGTNVKAIGKNAFANCKSLTKVTFKGKKVKTVGAKAFYKAGSKNYKKLQVIVPRASCSKYKKLLQKAKLSKAAKIKKKS